MNRKRLLLEIQKHLKIKQALPGFSEFLLVPRGDDELRRRSIFIVGVTDADHAVVQANVTHAVEDEFDVRSYYSPTIEDILNSGLVPTEDNKTENNWRGRILTRLQANKTPDELKDILLVSTWRMLIQFGHEDEYFGRHDIVPALWDPGYSIPGTKDFRKCVSQTLDYLARPSRLLDKRYDKLQCFGLKDPDRVFTKLFDDPFTIEDVLNQKDETRRRVEEAYQRFFTTR